MSMQIWLTKEGAPYTGSALLALADQEGRMLWCRENAMAALHMWRHQKAVLLGARDAALPGSAKAIARLCTLGYAVAVRPFGGLAVVLDEGVLNVTLILPGSPAMDEGFTALSAMLQGAFGTYGAIHVGEVAGSYCPGRYDLSLFGRKIIGIAQRRIAGAVAISAFVNVGPGTATREHVVNQFYKDCAEADLSGAATWTPPVITLGATGSICELVGSAALSVSDCSRMIIEEVAREGYVLLQPPALPSRFFDMANDRLRRGKQPMEWV